MRAHAYSDLIYQHLYAYICTYLPDPPSMAHDQVNF